MVARMMQQHLPVNSLQRGSGQEGGRGGSSGGADGRAEQSRGVQDWRGLGGYERRSAAGTAPTSEFARERPSSGDGAAFGVLKRR